MTKYSHHNPDSLHELLASRREALSVSLEELAKKTSIPIKHLQRIERGEWERLPSPVYTKGFLRKYARLVGCNPDEVVRSYQRLHSDATPEVEAPREGGASALTLSPRIARIGGVLVLAALIVGYAAYQLRTVVAHPDLTLIAPAEQEVVVTTDTVVLEGYTDAGTEVFLNRQPVAVGTDGTFNQRIDLLPGINNLTVSAVSRFNKETTIERRVIYTP